MKGVFFIESLLEKLSSYNLLNNLLPGAIFCYLLKTIVNIDISNNIVEDLFVYYFIGMIISRIGSIIIEPIYKKLEIVKYVDYKSFLKASKFDEKINILSETNNMYRTFVALTITLGLIKVYIVLAKKFDILSIIEPYLIIIILIVVFSVSYRKQVKYIKDRTEVTLEDNNSNNVDR